MAVMGAAEPSRDDVLQVLSEIMDPELDFSIVELGLIRDIVITPESIVVSMTLTSPGCPHAPRIFDEVIWKVSGLAGGRQPEVELVLSPPWDPRRDAGDEVKAELNIWD